MAEVESSSQDGDPLANDDNPSETEKVPLAGEMDAEIDPISLRENILKNIAGLASNPQLANELEEQLINWRHQSAGSA